MEFSDEKYINEMMECKKGFGENEDSQQENIYETIVEAIYHLNTLSLTNNFLVDKLIN